MKTVFIALYLIVVKILLSASHFMVLLRRFELEKELGRERQHWSWTLPARKYSERWRDLLIGGEEAAGFVEELEEFGAVAVGVWGFAFEGEVADLVPGQRAAVGALAEH